MSAEAVAGRGTLTRQESVVDGTVKNETFSVTTLALVCAKCGHVALEGKDVQEHLRRVADAYRKSHGLLTGEEIKSSRRRLKMSQRQFARYLKVGEASIKRWELGAIQGESHDQT